MSRIEEITARELDATLERAWTAFQAADPDLRSPFFSPAFCRIVAQVRSDVRIAVMTDAGEPVGFFPFHRQRFGRLAPLAGQISDYHGIIGQRGARGDLHAVLRALKGQVYDFNHVPVSQPQFRHHAYLQADSPLVDLSAGFDSWFLGRRSTNKGFRALDRKGRKLDREVGPLRFVANEADPAVWQQLLSWKRDALAGIGVKLILDRPWAGAVVDRIRQTDTPGFGGMTSALWAGDALAAVSFSMRNGTTGHSWFPTFNPQFSRASPGLLLLIEIIRHAADIGLTEYDLGRGPEQYKREFANGARDLCEGSVERPLTPLGLTRKARKAAQVAAEKTGKAACAEVARRAGNRLLSAGRIF